MSFFLYVLFSSDISMIGASECKKSPLMSQHDDFFFRVVREASKDGVPFQVLISVCNAADIIYRSNGKPHDSAEPKSAVAWELRAAICPSGRRTRHKPFCALRYQPLQFPPAPLFTLMSQWLGACHPIHAASRVACPSKSLCWHQVQYLGCKS